jgi:hypothetical protein
MHTSPTGNFSCATSTEAAPEHNALIGFVKKILLAEFSLRAYRTGPRQSLARNLLRQMEGRFIKYILKIRSRLHFEASSRLAATTNGKISAALGMTRHS